MISFCVFQRGGWFKLNNLALMCNKLVPCCQQYTMINMSRNMKKENKTVAFMYTSIIMTTQKMYVFANDKIVYF